MKQRNKPVLIDDDITSLIAPNITCFSQIINDSKFQAITYNLIMKMLPFADTLFQGHSKNMLHKPSIYKTYTFTGSITDRKCV